MPTQEEVQQNIQLYKKVMLSREDERLSAHKKWVEGLTYSEKLAYDMVLSSESLSGTGLYPYVLTKEVAEELGCDSKISFFYFTHTDGAKVTVAYTLDTNKDIQDRLVNFGVSVCSPKDQFSKRVGRFHAIARLISTADDASNAVMVSLFDHSSTHYQITNMVEAYIRLAGLSYWY